MERGNVIHETQSSMPFKGHSDGKLEQPGALLGAGDTAVNKIDKTPNSLPGAYILGWGGER